MGDLDDELGEVDDEVGMLDGHRGDLDDEVGSVAALPDDVAGALIVLGDMPGITAQDLDRLIEAFRRTDGQAIVRATHAGKRGNPVILPRILFPAVATLEGDTGARHLVEADGLDVVDVEIGAAASVDVDTREALESAGGVLQD